MIISHNWKFIFIKTAKTASTSMEIALSGICGDHDIITPISRKDEKARRRITGRGAQNYRLPLRQWAWKDLWFLVRRRRWPRLFYNHISASEIRALIPKITWENYFKFCFERNPFDKVISYYNYVGGKTNSVNEFIDIGMLATMPGLNLYTENGIPVVDRIYKYEEMDDALEDITRILGLKKKLKMPKYRAKVNMWKDKRHYKETLTTEEIEKISKIYAREIELLGYQY